MESLLKTLWRRLRFYLIDWGLIARRGIFYIGGSDTLPPPGSVKLRHHRGQRQQKAVAEEDRRQPDGGPDGHGGHIRGAVATRHHGIDKTHRRLRHLRKDDGYSQS
jgi:hypothetical protein